MLNYTDRTRMNRVLWISLIAGILALYACRLTDQVVGAVFIAMVITVIAPTLAISVILHNVQRRRPALRFPEHNDLSPNYWRDNLL